MSESSRTEGSSPVALVFDHRSFDRFDVEVADKGNDIVYHFWPPGSAGDFPNAFAKHLEDAFKSILPETADVRAAFTSKEEAEVLSKFGDVDSPPVPSYYVKVIGWADNPMADKFLKQKVFEHLSALLLKSSTD